MKRKKRKKRKRNIITINSLLPLLQAHVRGLIDRNQILSHPRQVRLIEGPLEHGPRQLLSLERCNLQPCSNVPHNQVLKDRESRRGRKSGQKRERKEEERKKKGKEKEKEKKNSEILLTSAWGPVCSLSDQVTKKFSFGEKSTSRTRSWEKRTILDQLFPPHSAIP